MNSFTIRYLIIVVNVERSAEMCPGKIHNIIVQGVEYILQPQNRRPSCLQVSRLISVPVSSLPSAAGHTSWPQPEAGDRICCLLLVTRSVHREADGQEDLL